jgi:hypothetical protein
LRRLHPGDLPGSSLRVFTPAGGVSEKSNTEIPDSLQIDAPLELGAVGPRPFPH